MVSVPRPRPSSLTAPLVPWLDSALSLTVQQLEKRIQDGTDTLASVLRLSLTEDQHILWENAVEIFRRHAKCGDLAGGGLRADARRGVRR